MLRKAFLHIGTGKTGTSSIQETALRSKIALASFGYLFPGNERNHFRIGMAMSDEPKAKRHMATQGWAPAQVKSDVMEALAAFDREVSRSDCDVLLVSSESFMTERPEPFDRLVDHLRSLAEEVEVVCYIRHPTAMAVSALQQRVKMGQGTLAEFDPVRHIRRFSQKLDSFGPSLAKCTLTVRPFDREQLRDSDAVVDFFHICGLTAEQIRQLDIAHTNQSLCHEAVLMLNALNRLEPRFVDGVPNPNRSQGVEQPYLAMRGQAFTLPEDLLQRIEELSRPEVERLERSYGLTFKKPNYPQQASFWGTQTIEDIATELNRLQVENARLRTRIEDLS